MLCAMTKRFFSILLLGLGLAKFPAAELKITKQIDVWPSGVPGEKGEIPPESITSREYRGESIQILSNVSKPTLTVYKPEPAKDTGASVVICPGGGYNILAIEHEGTEVAAWLNSIGVTGVVLKYRVPRRKDLEKHDAPLQDVQRAVSLVRHHGKEWGLDPKRIGTVSYTHLTLPTKA